MGEEKEKEDSLRTPENTVYGRRHEMKGRAVQSFVWIMKFDADTSPQGKGFRGCLVFHMWRLSSVSIFWFTILVLSIASEV